MKAQLSKSHFGKINDEVWSLNWNLHDPNQSDMMSIMMAWTRTQTQFNKLNALMSTHASSCLLLLGQTAQHQQATNYE